MSFPSGSPDLYLQMAPAVETAHPSFYPSHAASLLALFKWALCVRSCTHVVLASQDDLMHFKNCLTFRMHLLKLPGFFFKWESSLRICMLVLHCKGQVCANTTVSLYCASLYDTLQNKGWAYCVLPYGLAVGFTFGYLFFLLFLCLCATHFIAFLG